MCACACIGVLQHLLFCVDFDYVLGVVPAAQHFSIHSGVSSSAPEEDNQSK